MSNANLSKKAAFCIFAQEIQSEAEMEACLVMNIDTSTNEIITYKEITEYYCLMAVDGLLERFREDMRKNNIDIFDNKLTEYYDKFITLIPTDVYKTYANMEKIQKCWDGVLPDYFDTVFNSYQGRLINLRRQFSKYDKYTMKEGE